jgi:hypothetical protein
MAEKSARRTLVIAIVAVVLAAGLGYWGYSAYKKRELRGGIAELLKDAGGRMREALTAETGPAPASQEEFARKLDEHIAAVEKLQTRFNQLGASRDRVLADDADNLLVGLREILRRQAASHRLYQLHVDSLQALHDHMRADNRTGAWVQQAVRAKERAEKDFRDYRLAVAAFATQLGALPAAQKKVGAHVDPAPLLDEGLIRKAREQALENAARANAEMEKMRAMLAPK